MSGWIKLHRKITNHWVFKKPEYFHAWVIILLTVNHASQKEFIEGEIIECGRGQSILSTNSWALKFGRKWTRQKVRTFFNLLQKDEMISLEGLRKTTRLTVCKYDSYQDVQPTDNQETTKRQPRDNQETTTNKNDKKNNNDKNGRNIVRPTIENVIKYFSSNGYSKESAIKAFNYYDAGNWHDSSGKPVLSWKQKMISQWFKPENKIKVREVVR